MNRFFLAFFVAGFALLSASCGKQDDGVIRWAFWGNEDRVRLSQEAIDVFQKANPDIRINVEPAGGSGDHFNRVDIQIAGGNPPDIIQMGGNFWDYAKRGVILPLDEFVESGLLNSESIDQGILNAGRFEGRLYGLPTGITVPALIYNKSLLERLGLPLPKVSQTFDEFLEYLLVLREKLPENIWPMMDFGFSPMSFGYWLRYNGTLLFDDVTNGTEVTAQIAQKYLELWQQYRNLNLIPSANVAAGFAETNSDTSSLVAGIVVITVGVSTQLAGLQSAVTDELELIEMPGAATNQALWPQLSQLMTVSQTSGNKDGAVRFIEFAINSPEAGRILGSNRGSSASETFRSGESASPVDQKINAYHEVAGPNISPESLHLPNATEFESTLVFIYQQVIFGQLTPAQGGQQLYELVARLAKS